MPAAPSHSTLNGVNGVNVQTLSSVTGVAAANHLTQVLDDSNRLDNELPFVVTNPLPDLVLDDMDRVFVLRPE